MQEIKTIEEMNALHKAKKLLGTFEMSNDLYHAGPGHSASGLKKAQLSMAHYQNYKKRKQKKANAAQNLGTAVHMAVLEPHLFKIGVGITVVENLRTKAGKFEKEEAEKAGRLVLNMNQFFKAEKMSQAVMQHPLARNLFSKGTAEVSCFAEDPTTGLLMKCRPDYLHDDGVIVDLKTFGEDLEDWSLQWQIYRMKYHWQAAWYSDVVSEVFKKQITEFNHVFVETPDDVNNDYVGVRVIALNDASLDKARDEYGPVLQNIAQAEELDSWPGYSAEAADLSLPDKVFW